MERRAGYQWMRRREDVTLHLGHFVTLQTLTPCGWDRLERLDGRVSVGLGTE